MRWPIMALTEYNFIPARNGRNIFCRRLSGSRFCADFHSQSGSFPSLFFFSHRLPTFSCFSFYSFVRILYALSLSDGRVDLQVSSKTKREQALFPILVLPLQLPTQHADAHARLYVYR